MIIEIKGLPEGQSIKHINVDITFGEDGVVNVKTTPTIQTPNVMQTIEDTNIKIPEMSEREHKEVPPEMLDMEF